MNQIKPKDDYVAEEVAEEPKPTPPKPSQAEVLHRTLVSGKHALARQSDLTQMHKSTVKILTTLTEGLSDMNTKKAAKDRAEICERLVEMEQSVNGMEGILRIEMAPQIRLMLNEALDERQVGASRRLPRILRATAVLMAGILVGTLFADTITHAVSTTLAEITTLTGKG